MVRHLAVVALLVVPFLSARAEVPRPLGTDALGFTASFPYPAKVQVELDGTGTAAAFGSGTMYMVGVTHAEKPAASFGVKEQLDAGIQGMADKVKGTVTSQKGVKLGKHPGREVEIALKGGRATFRVYLVRPRVYLVGVVRMDDATLPMPPAEFFASFRLVPPPKGSPSSP